VKHLAPPEREDCISTHLSVNTWYQTRQGRLEIKWRKVELGVVHFGDRVRARQSGANGCVKTHSREQTADVVGKSWVSVKKVRAAYQIFPGK